MKHRPLIALTMSMLLASACTSPKVDSAKSPRLKITASSGLRLRPDTTWVSVEGIGATPGEPVRIVLLQVTEGTPYPPTILGTTRADESGFFAYSVIKDCIFPHGQVSSSAYYRVVDEITGRSADSHWDLGSTFLECGK